MQEWIEVIKAAVRPFVIVWGCIVYGVCIIKGITVPALLMGLVAAVVIEYFGERALLRLGQNNGNDEAKGD